ncbi:probable peptidyl-tRNA hydrolase [Octopus sinensis]|uniref:Probable peptidyl-tRNA hydrolase n=1 Tax=Octopus sinensis TaxID=2607531 RepID=A0A6P7THL1_9MOLL|nr:probable peptidyl-tRNA hydrolase [Octopus sinensis]
MQSPVIPRHVLRFTQLLGRFMSQRKLSSQPVKLQNDKVGSRLSEKYMIVGLGHDKLSLTRHSVGLQLLDCLADELKLQWKDDKETVAGHVAVSKLDDVSLILLKPQIPMMVNGTSVSKAARHFDVPPENVYLIHDDIGRRMGKIALKNGGSANGHSGVKSVLDALDSEKLTRLKIGIDRPAAKDQIGMYLQEEFSPEEQVILDLVMDLCLTTLCQHLKDKTGVDMNDLKPANKT